jgi:hypothetical protein
MLQQLVTNWHFVNIIIGIYHQHHQDIIIKTIQEDHHAEDGYKYSNATYRIKARNKKTFRIFLFKP